MQADVVANNLANVNTGGFKRVVLQIESTPTMDIYRSQTDPGRTVGTTVPGQSTLSYVGKLGFGSRVYDTPSNFEQGALEQTGNPLNFAISGDGFFTLQTAQGVRYTRDGSFVRNAQGLLTTQNGDLVLSQQGTAITIPDGKVTANAQGQIAVDNRPIANLQVTTFGNPVGLRPEGSTRYVDSGVAQPQTDPTPGVVQGALEKSNADVIHSMIDLITAQRWFEANEKVVQTQDTAVGEAITQIGHNSGQ